MLKKIYYTDLDINKKIKGSRFSASRAPLFNKGGPKWLDICQWRIGNCYLLSALQSIALRNPEFIENQLICDRGDGTVRVRLFEVLYSAQGDLIRYQPIDYILEKSIPVSGDLNKHRASWVELVEKAYAMHRLDVIAEKDLDQSSYAGVLSTGSADKAYMHILGCASTQQMSAYSRLSRVGELLLDLQKLEDYLMLKDYVGVHVAAVFFDKIIFDEDMVKALRDIFEHDEAHQYFTTHFPKERYASYYALLEYYLHNEKCSDSDFAQGVNEILKEMPQFVRDLFISGISLARKQEEIHTILFKKLQAGELICANTISIGPLVQGLINQHAYYVINVYQGMDGKRFVQLGNPWGNSTPSPRYVTEQGRRYDLAIPYDLTQQTVIDNHLGTFELPLEKFIGNFYSISNTDFTFSSQIAMNRVINTQTEREFALSQIKKLMSAATVTQGLEDSVLLNQKKKVEDLDKLLDESKEILNTTLDNQLAFTPVYFYDRVSLFSANKKSSHENEPDHTSIRTATKK